jgi:cell division septal protein FtsQ
VFRRKHSKGVRTAGAPEKGRLLGSRLKRQQVKKRQPAEKHPNPWRGLGLRLGGRLLGLAGIFAVVGLGLLAGWAFLIAVPAFEVKEANVTGVEHLSRLDVLRTSGVGSHSNILALNVGKVEQRLLKHPWVARARVERVLPGKVNIEIHERRPELVALVEGRFYYLDGQFRSFALMGSETAPDLAVVTGLSLADLVSPDDEMAELLGLAKKLWSALPEGDKGPGGRLSEMHLDRVSGFSLIWNDLDAAVHLGFEDFSRRLARLERVRADLAQRGELGRAVLIDLDAERRVVVRLAGEAA